MTWAAVAGAVIGAVGSYASAKKANKQKKSWTEQESTQNPYMADNINPRLEDIINLQGQLVDRGSPQVGPNGQIYYDSLPGRGGQTTPGPGPGYPGGGGPGRGGNNSKKKKGKGGGQLRGAVATTNTPGTAPPASAEDIFRQAADRGFAAGDTATQEQARTAMGNILGAAGGGGPESTGFEGYNPILDRLATGLGSDFDERSGRDLLLGFLNENGRGGAGNPPAAPRPGGGRGGGANVRYNYQRAERDPGTGGVRVGPNQGVPDTMIPESYFGTETRKIMDEEANQKELEDMISLMNEDVERGMYRDLASLDAAAQGSGRFGGDMFMGMSRDAREEALQEMSKNAAKVRVGDREARRQARLAALGGVNTRDLSLLNANVQREGIAAGERNAASAASAAGAGAAEAAELARRGQDLSALGALLDYEKFGTGQLGDIGSQLSSDRMNTLGLVPGLEGIGLQGLNVALGGGQGLADIRANAANAANARAGINVQRQGQLQNLGMFNAGQQQGLVNDYLRTMMGIGGMGGTSVTRGTNVQPGAGVSPMGSAMMGALGGASTGAGIGQYFSRPSDIRLKHDIRDLGYIGHTGIRLVEWSWRPGNIYGLDGRDIGVIAQEVMRVLPEAVAQDIYGYYNVDYALLGDYVTASVGEAV